MILVFLRTIAFFTCVNVFYPKETPRIFKISFALFLSIIISSTIDLETITQIDNKGTLVLYGICETLTGLMLGYVTNICFESIKFAGSLIDQQLGLSMSNIYDPSTQTQSTLISNIMYWMSIIIFLNLDGHHILINGIRYSFDAIPLGQSVISNNFDYILNIFIYCIATGFKIAVPIVVALIITEFIMGLVSRSVPQLNVMIVGMPIKILVGLAFFMISLPFIVKEIIELINNIPNIYEGTFGAAPLFYFLSTDDKTEEATPKKKKDARKKGNVPKSKEVSLALTLVGFTILIGILTPYLVDNFRMILTNFLNIDFKMDINYRTLQNLNIQSLIFFFKLFLPIGAIFLILGIIANLAQTGILFTGEGLKPSFSKLNPINGFKNMFSMKSMGNLMKNILIIIVLGFIGYGFIKDNYIGILKLSNIYIPTLIYTVKDILYSILLKISIALVVIALLDYLYQRYTHKKDLKMTKQEIKEEFKQMEGDPQIKGRIKQKQRQLATQRMMQKVPDATVILTNPTHLSIAIKYEQGKSKAPIVVAKGADYVALKIREIAKENDIPIIENKPLARLIFKKVEIDQEIPEEMYQAVAEILVAIYKMKNRYKTK